MRNPFGEARPLVKVLLIVAVIVGVVPVAYAQDVVINEIMQNPAAVSDSAGEWFEVFNPTGKRRRHQRLDDQGQRHRQPRHQQWLGHCLIAPGGFWCSASTMTRDEWWGGCLLCLLGLVASPTVATKSVLLD